MTSRTDAIVSAYNNVTSCRDTQRSNARCNCECYIMSSDSKRRNDDLEFLYAFVSVSVKDNVLPATFLKGNFLLPLAKLYGLCNCIVSREQGCYKNL